jgi:hypothetical protein
MKDIDLIHKLTYALEDVRDIAQTYHSVAPVLFSDIISIVDKALKGLCPQCHHGHEAEEPRYCEVMCPPEPGETEPWKCHCSDRYHNRGVEIE